MHPVAVVTFLAASATAAAPLASAAVPPGPTLPAGLIEVEDHPLCVTVVERGGTIEVFLLRERDLDRFRLEGRGLVPIATFRAPTGGARPLSLDAAAQHDGGDPLVAAVFGEDVRSVDQGTETRLHSFVLAAGQGGALRPVSDDLGAWLRIADGHVYLQRRGTDSPASGPVRRVEKNALGRYAPGSDVIPWAGRSLLDATPLPGGAEVLAWEGERLEVVRIDGRSRVPGGSMLADLGDVDVPAIALRTDRPMLRGLDREGRTKDQWHPVPRRVRVASDGGAYTVARGRSKRFLGRASGQDALVRLDWSEGALALSRPYPAVDAFVLDFALLNMPGRPPAAVLLVNDKEDGSGRAYLVFQEPARGP